MSAAPPQYWQQACAYLTDVDPLLGQVINNYHGEYMQRRGSPFFTLARSIVGQQISVKAADSVWNRLETTLQEMTPEALLQASHEQLRACGLSQQKSRYLVNVATFCQAQNWQQLETSGEQHLRASLLEIKGVGVWTWEMFAIFYLQLPDIFPIGDIGVINACKKLYGHANKQEVADFAERWRPYRTVATWYLWRSLDPVAVAY